VLVKIGDTILILPMLFFEEQVRKYQGLT